MPIKARPQLNGNTVEDFTAAFYALGDAEKAVAKAIQTLMGNVVHGRNYQHLTNSNVNMVAVAEDRRKVEELRTALRTVSAMKLDIVAAIQPERPSGLNSK